ncbi:hypothetical protein DFH06DRAFT_1139874 [Mycena polygramma]|nr:hypothetical protein DFH06DRAFT_1139874 [Mycena polygramma]
MPSDQPAKESVAGTQADIILGSALLHDFSGIIVNFNDIEAPMPCVVDIPSLKPVSQIGRTPEIQARRVDALQLGSKAIDKPALIDAAVASRRLFLSVFSKELNLLERVLTHLEHIRVGSPSPSSPTGYRVQQPEFRLLMRTLWNTRSVAEDSFRLLGSSVPRLPSWGNDDDILDFHNENDFEILGVCFRAEVEQFLVSLDKVHDFPGNKPRDSSLSRPLGTTTIVQKTRNSPAVIRTPSTYLSASIAQRRVSGCKPRSNRPRRPQYKPDPEEANIHSSQPPFVKRSGYTSNTLLNEGQTRIPSSSTHASGWPLSGQRGSRSIHPNAETYHNQYTTHGPFENVNPPLSERYGSRLKEVLAPPVFLFQSPSTRDYRDATHMYSDSSDSDSDCLAFGNNEGNSGAYGSSESESAAHHDSCDDESGPDAEDNDSPREEDESSTSTDSQNDYSDDED